MRFLCRFLASPAKVMRTMALLVLPFATVSCTAIAKGVARDLARTHVEREFVLPAVPQDFSKCLESSGGVCPGGSPKAVSTRIDLGDDTKSDDTGNPQRSPRRLRAELAAKVLNSEVQQSLVSFYNACVEPRSSGGRADAHAQLELDLGKLEAYLRDVEAATAVDAWGALDQELYERAQKTSDGQKKADLDRQWRKAVFIREYTQAYFRNGQFFTATLDTNALKQTLNHQFGDAMSEEELDDMVRKLLGFDPKSPFFGKLGTKGFVTRGGQNFQFQNVEATVNPAAAQPITVTAVDYTRAGSDLVRVFIHAIFDAADGLPAVADATGATLGTFGLPVNKPGNGLADADFAKVEQIAASVECVVSAGVGRLIRGAGWASLNNEALAGTLETLVGVTTRKYAEKAAWCWYKCPKGAQEQEDALGQWETNTVTIVVTGPENRFAADPWR